jgi:hypothetical protein
MRSARALLLTVSLAAAARADDKAGFANVGDVNADVSVLNVLHTLQPTPAQLKALLKAAPKTMQKPPPRKLVKVSEKLRKTMTGLRDALAAGDDEKIDELFTAFDKLRDKENPEFDEVEISDAAREQAPAIVRMLSARQVANYAASIADFPDPVERLADAMDQSRKLRGQAWQALRDDTAYQVGYLVGGLDEKADGMARDQATALLNKAFRLDDKQFAAERDALEKEARGLVGKLGPTDVIRHFMERVIAETLSSHRLEAAIELRAKKAEERANEPRTK